MVLTFPLIKLKQKVTIFLVILFLLASVYFYLNHLQQSYNSAQWSGERCLSELSSIKYQLNVVTEYKNRIDKLLTETQKTYDSEKERCKDVMDSCLAMKQQTAICQRNTVRLWVRRYQETGDVKYNRQGPRPMPYTNESKRHRHIVNKHTIPRTLLQAPDQVLQNMVFRLPLSEDIYMQLGSISINLPKN